MEPETEAIRTCPRCFDSYAPEARFCPLDGTPLTVTTDALVGRVIAGRLRLLKLLGIGSMSRVYLARHILIGRLTAIKVLRADNHAFPRLRARFLREALAVNRIHHPHIVEVTDFGESQGLVYMLMEYVAGESLAAHLHGGGLPWRRAANIGQQIASALAHAHQAGVIHRDLKPENVLLTTSATGGDFVKLTDFGIARTTEGPALTLAGELLGTPGYMAPEYLRDGVLDGRSDLYALGVVLYEMLTGAMPHDARDTEELLARSLHATPVPLRQRVDDVPPVLERLVLRLLSHAPEDRPQDAFAVEAELLDMLEKAGAASDDAVSGSTVMGVARRVEPTLNDAAIQGGGAQPMRAPSRALTRRWAEIVEALERSVQANDSTASRANARAPIAEARRLLGLVQRTSAVVEQLGETVEHRESEARTLRKAIGAAIHERARHRAALQREIASLLQARLAMPPDKEPAALAAAVDRRLWQRGKIEGDLAQLTARDSALGEEVAGLKAELHSHNERLESELPPVRSKLEAESLALHAASRQFLSAVQTAVAAGAIL